jgi:putative SOS response-associated peptidase YedK
MCGRYASSADPDSLVEAFDVDEVETDALPADYNVAPTKQVYAVLDRRHRDDAGEPTGDPTRRLRAVRWGLVPSWAKDPGIGTRLINARAESLADKPAFRRAFARRRCLLPADGYYEWRAAGPDAPTRRKQPFFITAVGSREGGAPPPLAMAGLYEIWHDPAQPQEEPGSWWWTVTVVTTDAGVDVAEIHDRMPVLLAADAIDRWLDPDLTEAGQVADLLRPAPAGTLQAFPVATDVNNVRTNGEHLCAPLPWDEPDALF